MNLIGILEEHLHPWARSQRLDIGDAVAFPEGTSPGGISWKEPVAAHGDKNVGLSGAQTIDGVPVTVGQRVLLTGQSDPRQNGIWQVSLSFWVRPSDFSHMQKADNAALFVQAGTVHESTAWVCTNDTNADVIDSFGLTFVAFVSYGP